MRRECRERHPQHRHQRKPLISVPDMHHGTCVMSESLTSGGGENVPGIPGACAPTILRIWQEAHSVWPPHTLSTIFQDFPDAVGTLVRCSAMIPGALLNAYTKLLPHAGGRGTDIFRCISWDIQVHCVLAIPSLDQTRFFLFYIKIAFWIFIFYLQLIPVSMCIYPVRSNKTIVILFSKD